jgi:hypothetical protein
MDAGRHGQNTKGQRKLENLFVVSFEQFLNHLIGKCEKTPQKDAVVNLSLTRPNHISEADLVLLR